MKELYDWLFHFNHHTGKWAAFKRDDREKYFNTGHNRERENGILFADDLKDLINFITKNNE